MDFSFLSFIALNWLFLLSNFCLAFTPQDWASRNRFFGLMVIDIVHLTSAARFPCYWLFCFALQIFDFRVVVWHISSDTNDFVFFSEVLNTSSVPFWICLYTSRQRARAMKHVLSWITWSPSTHYLVDRRPSNHFLKESLTRHTGFICNFPGLLLPEYYSAWGHGD